MTIRHLSLTTLLWIVTSLAIMAPALANAPVSVTVATHTTLNEKDAKRLAKVEGMPQVETQLAAALAKAGATGISVRVEVDEFRLRTQKQISWGGLASGGDYIGAQVIITPEGGQPSTRKAKGALVTGSIAGKEPKRLAKIVEGLVADIVAGL